MKPRKRFKWAVDEYGCDVARFYTKSAALAWADNDALTVRRIRYRLRLTWEERA